MTKLHKTALELANKIEEAGLVGLVIIGKVGSGEVQMPVVGTAKQIGILSGMANATLPQQFLEASQNEYADYLNGFLKGSALAYSSKTKCRGFMEVD